MMNSVNAGSATGEEGSRVEKGRGDNQERAGNETECFYGVCMCDKCVLLGGILLTTGDGVHAGEGQGTS